MTINVPSATRVMSLIAFGIFLWVVFGGVKKIVAEEL